jgi:hypothetical protein
MTEDQRRWLTILVAAILGAAIAFLVRWLME